jgi:acyl-coenzyme A synthetase/AMP-(fatty) acid ligase
MGLLGMLASGAKLLVETPRSWRHLYSLVEMHRPGILVAVPALYDLWSRGSRARLPAGLLHTCITSGSPLTASVATAFEQIWGRYPARQYGMSECGAISIDLEMTSDPHCVGYPYPGVRLRIDNPYPTMDGVGEIMVESPYAGTGYVGTDASSTDRNSFTPTGIRTNDRGRIDAEGRLHLVGRSASRITVHGQKVDHIEVEQVIGACRGVRDVLVVGIEMPDGDESVTAFFVGDETVEEEELRLHCRRNLAPYKVPRRFTRLEAIPRTSMGKVQRVLLARLIEATSAD